MYTRLSCALKWPHFPSADDPPTFPELQRFPVKDGFKDIVAEIQTDYEQFGLRLLEDSNGLKVKAIEKAKQGDPVTITVEIVRQWLQGKGRHPVVWSTFVKCLRESRLDVLANYVDSALYRESVPDTASSIMGQHPEFCKCVTFS